MKTKDRRMPVAEQSASCVMCGKYSRKRDMHQNADSTGFFCNDCFIEESKAEVKWK